jgi:hypothetical protein
LKPSRSRSATVVVWPARAAFAATDVTATSRPRRFSVPVRVSYIACARSCSTSIETISDMPQIMRTATR